MTHPVFRRLAMGMIVVPLALSLAACGKSGENGTKLSGDPIETIAPPAGESWADVISKTEEGGYRMGNPDAPIKLVEFGSLTCSHCADFSRESSEEIRDKFVASGRVSYEFRNFVRDWVDLRAAQLTRCGSPESFFALTEQVFANQNAIIEKAQSVSEADFNAAVNQPEDKGGIALAQLAGLTDFFAARGIARDQANACLADAAAAQALAEAATKQGEEFDITGTPTFLINGQKQDINTWAEVKAKLETLGAR